MTTPAQRTAALYWHLSRTIPDAPMSRKRVLGMLHWMARATDEDGDDEIAPAWIKECSVLSARPDLRSEKKNV